MHPFGGSVSLRASLLSLFNLLRHDNNRTIWQQGRRREFRRCEVRKPTKVKPHRTNAARILRPNARAIRVLVLRMTIERGLLLLVRGKRALRCVGIRRMSFPVHVSAAPYATS